MNRSNAMRMICAAAVAALLAACGGDGAGQQATSSGAATLKLAASGSRGNILVDGDGRTLYYFAKDLPAGGGRAALSNCLGSASDSSSCVYHWPLYEGGTTLGAGINAGDVGQIVRSDGAAQTTYKGWPLYYFLGDATPGAVNGEAVEDWFVLRDPFYAVVTLDSGTTRLADGTGRSLYVFDRDTVGTSPTSACAGSPGDRTTCVGNWPIFLAGSTVLPTGIDSARFTVFTRDSDGRQQSAFDGHPLYYFADDVAPGDLKGLTFPPGLPHWSTIGPAAR